MYYMYLRCGWFNIISLLGPSLVHPLALWNAPLMTSSSSTHFITLVSLLSQDHMKPWHQAARRRGEAVSPVCLGVSEFPAISGDLSGGLPVWESNPVWRKNTDDPDDRFQRALDNLTDRMIHLYSWIIEAGGAWQFSMWPGVEIEPCELSWTNWQLNLQTSDFAASSMSYYLE